jgi:hypothetical protein
MKRRVLVFLFVGLLSATQLEGKGRGHARPGGFAPFRHPGAIIGPGIGSHGIRHGAFGFGFGRRGLGIRRSWPLFGSSLGLFYSEYNAHFQSRDYDAAPDSGNTESPTIYYYQKPTRENVRPNCKDSWTTKDSSSSLGNFMNRVFELQCQNRHPDAEANPSQGAGPAKN